MTEGTPPRDRAVTIAVIGAAATILAALIAAAPTIIEKLRDRDDDPAIGPSDTVVAEAAVFLSKEAAPAGATVNVSGVGFEPGETVVINARTYEVATTTAGPDGSFSNVAIVVPERFAVFAPYDLDVIASGRTSGVFAIASMTVSG